MSKVSFLKGGCLEEMIVFAVMYKTGIKYDPETIGEEIYQDDKFGMIDPPCRLCGFEYITDEIVDETYGVFSLKNIKDKFEIDKFMLDLNKLDYLFVYEDDNNMFQEVGHKNFIKLCNERIDTHSLDLREYEIGFDG